MASVFGVMPTSPVYRAGNRPKKQYGRPPNRKDQPGQFADVFQSELERQQKHVAGGLDVPAKTRSVGEDGLKF